MEKISSKHFNPSRFNSKQQKLSEIRSYIEKHSGMSPESIRISNQRIIVKAKNNYEATEIRLKLQAYIEKNNIRII